jgi:hypothetical protein
MTMDGANLLDPGNQGTQVANINLDQTAEVTLLNSAYGAEYAKGPVTFQAIGKSGTAHFHGAVYVYGRQLSSLDSTESLTQEPGRHRRPVTAVPCIRAARSAAGSDSRHELQPEARQAFFYIGPEGMNQRRRPVITPTSFPPRRCCRELLARVPRQPRRRVRGRLRLGRRAAHEHGAASAYPGRPDPSVSARSELAGLREDFPRRKLPQEPDERGNNYFYTGLSRKSIRVQAPPGLQRQRQHQTVLLLEPPGRIRSEPDRRLVVPGQRLFRIRRRCRPTRFRTSSARTSRTCSARRSPTRRWPRWRDSSIPSSFRNPSAVESCHGRDDGLQAFDSGPGHGANPQHYQHRRGRPRLLCAGVRHQFSRRRESSARCRFDPSMADNLSKVAGTHTMKFGAYWDFAENYQPGVWGTAQGTLEFRQLRAPPAAGT